MAELVVNAKKIVSNIKALNDYLEKHGKEWTLISKILSGHKPTLEAIFSSEEIKRVHSIGDSRLSSLKNVKEIDPSLVTMYIKPPAAKLADSIVKYADISLNTSIETIKFLDEAARNQKKIHRIVIMIEMGELREGVVRENIIDFYKQAFEMDNIRIDGIGTNLGCMYGVEPTYDKLIQLSLYKQLLEARFDRELKLISGGSSITLPLINQKKIPELVNHFRIGEAAFLGTTPLTNDRYNDLHMDTFSYEANILELEEKAYIPDGDISDASIGHSIDLDKYEEHDKTYKAIVDFGLLDVDSDELKPADGSVAFIGTTSDLTVFDVGENMDNKSVTKYKVGEKIRFKPSYMGAARLMNSKFVDKIIVG